MIRKLWILFLLLLLCTSPFNISTYAKEANGKSDNKLIASYEEDLTGNGLKDTIKLEGILFSPDSAFYKNIEAVITSTDNQQWVIQYDGGYDPTLQFIDLNHDKINDIFFQSPTGGSGGLNQYHIHTIAHNVLTEIPMPSQDVQGSFIENFKVQVQILPNAKPIIIDVKNRSADYIRLGVYNEQGKLLQPTSLMIEPIAIFEPIIISTSKGYGLKSYQQISGAYHADQLGTVETLWYYENGKWIILQTEWVPTSEKTN